MIIRYFCLLLLVLCGCKGSGKDSGVIRLSILRGPSAIVFAQWMENNPEIEGRPIALKILDSPEQMQAALIKGEVDIAAFPMINAANLYNKGIKYPLLGCPLWGTLYLIGKRNPGNSEVASPILHIFGAGTTPDILTRYYLQQHQLRYTLNYSFFTAPEIIQGLMAGKIDNAVLGEPFLSLALRKDTTLCILADLNNPVNSSDRFPQTAIVYSPAMEKYHAVLDSLVQESCSFATTQPEIVISILERRRLFAPGTLTPESIERSKIQYVPAQAAEESVLRFLRLIEQYEPKAIGDKVPDSGFISPKRL